MAFPLVEFESSDRRRTSGARGGRPSRRAFLTGAPRLDDSWIRVHRRAMACRFEITLESRDAAAVPAARDALNAVDRLEDALSVFRDASVISAINRAAAHAAVAVDDETFDLLRLCGDLFERTGGAFDITSTPLSRCWGFLQRNGRVPQDEALNDARARVGFGGVRLDAAARSVQFARPGIELNLGAIGKGYALDRVAGSMRRAGARHALMSAGRSSMLAIGGRRGGWFVELVSMRADGLPLADVHLVDAAIGTSGAGDQFVIVDGVRYGHVIDPRSGVPASGVESASAIASSAAVADALSTAFLVGGTALAEEYCARHPGVMAIVTEEGATMARVFGRHPGARVRARRLRRAAPAARGTAAEVTR
jgi:FAD:protein FMN transferase